MIDKNEIKRQYKETVQPMGIYQMRNLSNGKIFVGSSKNLRAKQNSFQFQDKLGAHESSEFLEDYNKYGRDNFAFEILDYLDPKEGPNYDYTKDLETLLELWIEKLQPFDEKGYNKIQKRNL